ncbi:hypothetical protein VTO73DRAFT_7766 [Trametes versicolor]
MSSIFSVGSFFEAIRSFPAVLYGNAEPTKMPPVCTGPIKSRRAHTQLLRSVWYSRSGQQEMSREKAYRSLREEIAYPLVHGASPRPVCMLYMPR